MDHKKPKREILVTAAIDPIQERQLIVVDVLGEPLDLETFCAALDATKMDKAKESDKKPDMVSLKTLAEGIAGP